MVQGPRAVQVKPGKSGQPLDSRPVLKRTSECGGAELLFNTKHRWNGIFQNQGRLVLAFLQVLVQLISVSGLHRRSHLQRDLRIKGTSWE